MDIPKMMSQFTKEEQKKLAAAQNAEELSRIAAELGQPLDGGEADAVFAALYPARGKEPLDEDELAAVSGGYPPQSSGAPKSQPTISPNGRF